jgi:hypothetical protein
MTALPDSLRDFDPAYDIINIKWLLRTNTNYELWDIRGEIHEDNFVAMRMKCLIPWAYFSSIISSNHVSSHTCAFDGEYLDMRETRAVSAME